MKRNNPDRIKLTVNITEEVYNQVMNYVRDCGVDEVVVIQKIVIAGALKLKLDMIEKKNSLLSSQVEYLRDEIKHFIGETSRLEKLRSEYGRDADYIKNRLDKLNSENKELEVLVIQQSSALRKEN